ncbi:hypothetical protein BN135_1628 [Cronobacter muytjensii 530]
MPKGYIYFAMFFSIAVEKNRCKHYAPSGAFLFILLCF